MEPSELVEFWNMHPTECGWYFIIGGLTLFLMDGVCRLAVDLIRLLIKIIKSKKQ